MSMIFMSGWETGFATDTWTSGSFGTGTGVSTTYRRGSQYSMLFTNSTDTCKKVFATGKDELYVQFAIFWIDDPADGSYLYLKDGLFNIAAVGVASSRLLLRLGSTHVATSEVIFQAFTWYVIEVHLKLHATNGVFEARVNGSNVCSYTGVTRSESCVARWRFESGVDIVADSVGSNTLINTNVNPETSIYREGAASADFDGSSSYFTITDENLSSDFPIKSTKYCQDFTVLFWVYLDNVTGSPYLFYKQNSFTARFSTTSFWYDLYDITGSYTSSNISGFSATTWYHFGLRVYTENLSQINCRVYNATTTAVTNTVLSNSFGLGSMPTSNSNLYIGSTGAGSYLNGKLDEMIVFKGLLGDSAVDSIRTGTYTAYTQTTINAIELASQTNNDVYFDDVIVNDTSGSYNNSWPNQARISKLQAMDDGPIRQFTGPFAKKHWEILQLYPVSGKAFYVSAPTTGLTEMLKIDSSPVMSTDILALEAVAIGRTEPISGATYGVNSFTFFLQSGNTIYEAAAPITVTANSTPTNVGWMPYVLDRSLWETSPISGVTWTSTEIDSLYLGVKT